LPSIRKTGSYIHQDVHHVHSAIQKQQIKGDFVATLQDMGTTTCDLGDAVHKLGNKVLTLAAILDTKATIAKTTNNPVKHQILPTPEMAFLTAWWAGKTKGAAIWHLEHK